MTSPAPKRPPIWILVVALAAMSAAIVIFKLRGTEQLSNATTIPWPLLVVGFVLAEVFVVHVHFRSDSGTFSFVELPLMLGALFASPLEVWASMTIGTSFALIVIRRQPLVKASFNCANLSLQAASALWIFNMLANQADPLGPQNWLAANAAAIISATLTVGAFVLVITVSEGRVDLNGIRNSAMMSGITSVTNVALALIAASLIDYRPLTLLLLLAPMAVLFASYRAFVSERAQRERVQSMYESASEISAMRERAAIPDILASTSGRLRARRADLLLFPSAGSKEPASRFTSDDDTIEVVTLGQREIDVLESLGASARAPQLISATKHRDLKVLVGETAQGMVGVVRGETGDLGVLVVTHRLGDVAEFSKGDLAMFSTVIEQLALALENDQLGQAVDQLKQVEKELSHEAHHDPLTGLSNRAGFGAQLDAALNTTCRVSLLYLDLDDFKLINDGLGHEAGDFVLSETARRMRGVAGPSDCVARLGGDEFAMILINAPDDMLVAERLLTQLNQPIHLPNHVARVSASIGLARARPGQEAAPLIASADAAMYSAKGKGKASVVLDAPAQPTGFRSSEFSAGTGN